MPEEESGCHSCSGDQMLSRVCALVAAGIVPACRTSFSLQTPHALWSHCTPAPKVDPGGLKIPQTDPHRVNILTSQVIPHQLQGVKFVTPHISLLHTKPLKKKQASGREENAFSGEVPSLWE